MSSVEYLREFVNERLTAAAEEIFGVFKKTVVEYEEEIDRQRRLLDGVFKSEMKIHKIEEEVLCNQERSSSLDQEQPEPPQIKEEEEELCSSQEGEQLVLKQETDTFMLTPVDEENDHSEDQTLDLNPDETLEESGVDMSVGNSLVSEEDSGSTEAKRDDQRHKNKSRTNNLYNPATLKRRCNTQTGKKSFKCDTCGKDFKFRSDLIRHLRIHTGEKPYICKTCGKDFIQRGNLAAHVRVHTGEKPYVCKTCGKRFCDMSGLKKHIRIHTGEKPYLCKTCGKDFSQRSNLVVHMKLHAELPQQHVCQEEEVLCNRERSSILDQEEPEPPQIKEEEEEPYSSQEGEQLVLKQETDTFMLTPVDEENDHSEDQTLDLNPDETLEESGVNMSVINSVVSEANRDQQLLSNNSHVAESQDQKGGDHEDSGSPGETMFKTHCSPPAAKKSFKCDICGKYFEYKSLFERHLRIHTGEKPYSCTTCGRTFRQSGELTIHMRRAHTGEKPYLCRTCGKSFGTSGCLSVHMRKHTGEKPFTCATCGRAFRRNCHLTGHTRRVHTGEKPYLCKVCGERFFDAAGLAKHKTRSHTAL